MGSWKSEGRKLQSAVGDGWKIIGFDENDHLQVGAFSDTSNLRDAVEFHPALIINGENPVAGTGLNEEQPRTAIGQAEDGTVIMLVVDGRQFHSFGISIESAAARSWRAMAHTKPPCWTEARHRLWCTTDGNHQPDHTFQESGGPLSAGRLSW